MKTRTEITVEMDRLIVVSRSRKAEWCPACAHRLEVLSSEDTTLVAERFADVPELGQTISDLIDLIQCHPWSFCSH